MLNILMVPGKKISVLDVSRDLKNRVILTREFLPLSIKQLILTWCHEDKTECRTIMVSFAKIFLYYFSFHFFTLITVVCCLHRLAAHSKEMTYGSRQWVKTTRF